MAFEALMEYLNELTGRGLVDTEAANNAKKKYDEGTDHLTAVREAREETIGRHAVVADRAGKAHEQWLTKTYNFIAEWEDERAYAYDDVTSLRITPSTPLSKEGKATIGVGFNLDRKGARKIIEDLGYDYDKMRKGEVPMPTSVIRKLANEDLRHSANRVRDIVGAEAWGKASDDQRTALTSMYFNGGTKLIAPGYNITDAVKAGDWKAVEHEIRNRSNKKQIPGLQNRREMEANWARPKVYPGRPKP